MTAALKTVWEDIVEQIRLNHPDLVRGWFAQLVPLRLDSGTLQIRAQNQAQIRYLTQHCHRAFTESAQAATGRLVAVAFEADGSQEEESAPPLSFEMEEGQLTLNTDYVFNNFVTGPCNRLAHAAALAVAEAPGKAYNPMFLHGATGLGKTHLLQAICHTINGGPRPGRILYLSCETFTNHFIEAVERGALKQFRYRYRHVDVLVIDDIQFLAERERSQEEFFHTFNTLHQSQRQIVLSADCPPSQIPSLEERLISRFNSGLVALMERPCLETRMAIIRKKAKLRCIEISEEVVRFVASKVDSNIRELEGALIKIDAFSQTQGGRMNLDLAYEALTGTELQRVTIPDILEVVTRRFSVRRSDLLSKKRNKSIAHPRQICMYMARELTPLSLAEIGGYFGGRDHATVLHAARRIAALRTEDPRFNYAVEEMLDQLRHERRNGD
ncbi:MAG TPA: chromosomal replication initiator protein DnaA [Phycisphaerae bacterium]|nr:chromosomal replication initiator protein DnaA [Phycisphaerae bacterium]